MEAQEAFTRRRETFGEPCIHTSIEKVFDHRLETGTWCCVDCGTEFGSRDMWEKLLHQQQRVTEA